MNANNHQRAEHLIAQERVEGISPSEREWLQQHLQECAPCAELARATEQALRSLRALSVPLPAALASRTQLRVRLRAQEMRQNPSWLVWAACGVSWAFGAATSPYVWRALQWLGHRIGAPDLLWQMGFAFWWALPAIVVAVVLLLQNPGQPTDRSWMRVSK
jgi:anti-sigma factor RsiW